jgi:hypothetical protein
MDIQEKTRVLEESIVITTWYTFVWHPKPFIYIRSLLLEWVMKYLNKGGQIVSKDQSLNEIMQNYIGDEIH